MRNVLLKRTQRILLPAVVALFVTATFSVLFAAAPVHALTTTPQRINFQGRLTDTSGNVVANGLYNMKFALYDTASAGNLKWSETRETTNRVQVTNGLFTVRLGDVSAFTDPTIFSAGSLYFEITLANPATATCSTASCQTWEGPMGRSQLATSAYAFNSDLLDGLDSTAFATASGSASYIQNQSSAQQATSNFWISGTGLADTALRAPLFDTTAATAMSIGTTSANAINIGSTTLSGTLAIGRSTITNTISIGIAAGNAATQTINIGTSGTAGSTTNVTIGSTIAGTVNIQGNVRLSKLTANGFVKTSGSNGALSVASTIALGSEVSGTLGIANGGTGVTGTPTNGQLLIGNGTGYALAALTGTGIAITNGAGSISLATSYGSVANTAVQGSITLTCPSGSGNVSGTGNAITLGSGGTCTSLNTVMNPNFTTSVTTPTLYATTLDTASAVAMNMGGTNASSINIGKSGSNITTTITGTAIIKPSTGNDSATAFQLQNASGAALFIADSTSSRLYIGPTAGNTTGVVLVLGNKTNTGDPTGVEGAMYYNSFAQAFRCYENGGWRNCVSSSYEVLDIKDEFMTGNLEAYENTWDYAGELGWSCREDTSPTPKRACEVMTDNEHADHPGVIMVTPATNSSGWGAAMALRPISPSKFDRLTFIVRMHSSAATTQNGKLRIGLLEDPYHGNDIVPSGAYFEYDYSKNATNWRTITKNTSTESPNDTNVPVVANTWYRLEIVKNASGNYEFYIDGTLKQTHTTNLPTAFQLPQVNIVNRVAAYTGVYVDYFSMRTKSLTR